MNNLNTITLNFPTVVKIQSAYEYSSNKSSQELTLADLRVLNPSFSVYILKKADVLEEDNVISSIRINVVETIKESVDEAVSKETEDQLDLMLLTKNLEKIKDTIEKELGRLHAKIKDKNHV